MAFKTDYIQLNAADDYNDWTYDNWSTTDNDTNATSPIYIEGSICQWWPLSKGVTDGYAYSAVTGSMVGGKIAVAWFNQTFADIANIPLTAMDMRLCSTSWTSNWSEWDMLTQIASPKNVPISGHTPFMIYPTNPDATNGTLVTTSLSHAGFIGTTGETNDGKQGGFDMIFIIGYIGYHSQTFTNDFFDDLYTESYDSGGSGLPGTADRPLGVFSRSGDFFLSNVKIQFGSGSTPNDTANTVVTETGKTIFFSNIEPEHELGYVFVDPYSTYENRLTLTDCVHFWASQQSTHEIFTNAQYAAYFQITGCSFTNGGKITLPADNANRWVRTTKFASCQTGTASDGEFSDCILQGCYAMTISGDADFTGTQVLAPAVTADTSGLIWNGNYDPNGNLDNMTFSKGSNDHHAIEFGTATPTTMTLTDIDFSGFTNTVGNNAAPLHIKRTSGSVTITLTDCTGITADGYKSDGATVTLVTGAVTIQATITDAAGTKIENALVFIVASDGTGPFPFEDTVTISNSGTTATVTHTAHGMASNDYVVIFGASLPANKGVFQITYINANSYSYTMASTPGSSPTGTITSTFVALFGLTNASGVVSTSRVYGANQNVTGWARKSTSSPFYKEGPLTGTIDSSDGISMNGVLVSDE